MPASRRALAETLPVGTLPTTARGHARAGTTARRLLAGALIATVAMSGDAGAQTGMWTDSAPWSTAAAGPAIEGDGRQLPTGMRSAVGFPLDLLRVPLGGDGVFVEEAWPEGVTAPADPPQPAAGDLRGPRIWRVVLGATTRQLSDTYVLGNEINVVAFLDKEIEVQGEPTLVLTIGSALREASVNDATGTKALVFKYRVQSLDYDPDGFSIAADAIRLNGGRVTDLAGNDADLDLGFHAITDHADHKVDGSRDPAPAVRSVEIVSTPPQGDTYVLGDRIRVLVGFDEDVSVAALPTLALRIGTATRQVVDDYARWTEPRLMFLRFDYAVQATDVDTNGISIDTDALRASVRDRTGQSADLDLGAHAIVDDTAHRVDGRRAAPTVVTGVRINPVARGGDAFVRLDAITVQVYFNRRVVVTGSPRLALAIGTATRHATYYATADDGRVFFQYEVQATDRDDDGLGIAADALMLNGGAIRDMNGRDVELDLGPHAVTNHPSGKLNGALTTAAGVANVLFHSRPQRGDTYAASNSIEVFVLFDAEIELTGGDGTWPELALEIGTETRLASLRSCVTQGQEDPILFCEKYNIGLHFAYDVQRGDVDDDGISVPPDALRLNGLRIRDRNGNDVALDLGRHAVVDAPWHRVDGAADYPPTVTEVYMTTQPQRGSTYGLGERIAIVVAFDEKVRVAGEPTLALRLGGSTRDVAYIPSRPGAEWDGMLFQYQVQAMDRDTDGVSIGPDALRLNGGSVVDLTGTAAESQLGDHSFGDHPGHRVDGALDHAPAVSGVWIHSRPRFRDTYRRGEEIEVRVIFDEPLWGTRPFTELGLALTIGAETRLAPAKYRYGRGLFTFGFGFTYVVQPSDRDADGLSIEENAFRGEGVVVDANGNYADLSLGSHALGHQPGHKVEGDRFTDEPIVPGETPIRTTHFLELRSRIDYLRAAFGESSFAWTDPELTPGVTPIRLVHLTELRSALDAAYAAAGRPAPTWTDQAAAAGGGVRVKAVHVTELRAAVVALERGGSA